MPTREQVYQALADLTVNVTWSSGKTFLNPVATRRRVVLFSDANLQPAIYQAEHDEAVAQSTKMPYKRIWRATWIVYQNVGKDDSAVPAKENNLILDAIENALRPRPYAGVPYNDQLNTLGGLVHHCFIDGEIFKDPGDIDGEGMMTIPITLLVP